MKLQPFTVTATTESNQDMPEDSILLRSILQLAGDDFIHTIIPK